MGNYAYRATCACGWEVEAQTKAERDRLDEEHLQYHRDHPDNPSASSEPEL
jgi:hypothetical protein